MTWIDLMRSSFRASGVLRPGQQPNNSEITDSLFVLNSMLESWGLESLNIYEVRRTEYPLTGAASYTIGPGGDFDTARPTRIERAGYTSGTGGCSECAIPILSRWRANPCSEYGLYNNGGFPVSTLYLSPSPFPGNHLALYTWQPLGQVISESETVELPPGYAEAVRYNLAVRIAAEWGRVPRPDVAQLAIETKAVIKSFNSSPPPEMRPDGFAGGYYDVYSDRYY